MAHKAEGASGGEYLGFNDPGGPTGSDLMSIDMLEEDRRLRLVIDETAKPLPVEDEGRLFNLAEGVVEVSGAAARKATQTCIHGISQAPARFYEGHLGINDIMARTRGLARLAIAENEKAYGISECEKYCILATLGKCPLAMLDLEISEPAFAELVGIQIRSKKPPNKEPAGVSTFKFFSGRSFSVSPPGLLLSAEEGLRETSAVKHIFDWWSKYRPKQKRIPQSRTRIEQPTLGL